MFVTIYTVHAYLGDLSEPPGVTGTVRQIAPALSAAGYTAAGVRRLLAVEGDIPSTPSDLVVHERRLLATDAPLADLIAVLALGWSRRTDRIRAAVGSAALAALLAAGALVEDGVVVQATVRLLPHGQLYLTSDRRAEPGTPPAAWRVTGINPPATLLAALTVRTAGARTLDLGTGNGIQALLAARHSREVVATDVNPRALAFGAFNAALNGVDRIEFRPGSWLEPVAGERFDLVVSNPPYVISPENDLVYRDSGAEPGALCRTLVGAIPEHLEANGFATVVVSWPLMAGEGEQGRWPSQPASWLGPGTSAWLLMLRSEDPLSHAAQWNTPQAAAGDLAGFGAAVDRWTGYLADRGITGIGYGAVIQQRASEGLHEPPRVLRADLVRAGAGSADAHIRRVFRASMELDLLDDAAIGAIHGTAPEGVQLHRRFAAAAPGWADRGAELALAQGVGISADLDQVMADVVLAATTGLSVDEAIDAVADRAAISAEDLRPAGRAMVRELLGLGLLDFADPADPDPTAD